MIVSGERWEGFFGKRGVWEIYKEVVKRDGERWKEIEGEMRVSLEIENPIFTLRALQIYFNNKTNSD